jgi:hypothetical protein
MSTEEKQKLEREAKSKIEQIMGSLKKLYEPGANPNSFERLTLELGLAEAINISAYKGHINQEEAKDYRVAALQIGGATA